MALTDLTRISTSGIATGSTIDSPILRKDISLRGSQVGITSALFDSSENELNLKDNVKLTFGDRSTGDLQLYHGGDHSFIKELGTGQLQVWSNQFRVHDATGSDTMIAAFQEGAVRLNFDGQKKIETTRHGAEITGILTATEFSGPISNPSGISTFYDLRVTNNLTVEGTTTTLDTNLIGVDRVEVGANSNSVVGVAITQSGTADIVNLFDGTTEVLTVKDGGSVGIGTNNPQAPLHIFDELDAVVRLESSDNGALYHTYHRDNAGTKTRIGYIGYGGTGGTLSIANEVPNGNIFLQTTPSGSSAGAEETAFRIHPDKKAEVYGDLQIPDKIIHTSDTNTAIRFPANDTITFETVGSERLRISQGNIGIGTTTPTEKLDIISATSSQTLRIWSKGSSNSSSLMLRTGDSGGAFIKFGDNSDNDIGQIHYSNSQEAMRFVVNTQERLRITSDGEVGIGTTNPEQKFQMVGGNIRLDKGRRLDFGDQYRTLQYTSDDTMTLQSPENVVICIDNNGNETDRIFAIKKDTQNPDDGSGTELFRVQEDGKVGIGTTVPKTKLHAYNGTPSDTGGILVSNVNYSANQDKPYLIAGTKDWSGATTNWNTFGFQHKIKSDHNGVPRITIDTEGGTQEEKFCVNNAGNVGIGSTLPTQKLDVANGAVWIYPNENGDEAVALKLGKLEGYIDSLNDILVSDDHDRVVNKINRYLASWHFDRTTSPGVTRINAFQLHSSKDGSNNGNRFIIRDLHDTADSIKLWSNGNSFVGVTTDGSSRNFGIGTNNPTAQLHSTAAYNVTGAIIGGGAIGYNNSLEVNNANGVRLLTVGGNGSQLTRGSQGGRDSTGNASNFMKIGTWYGIDQTSRLKITIFGTSTYDANADVAGETIIYISNNANNTMKGHFHSHSNNRSCVQKVAFKYDSSTSPTNCQVWIKYNGGYSCTQHKVDASEGYWVGADVDTSSTSVPSGATEASSFFAVATSDGSQSYERLRITSDGNIGINDSSPESRLTVHSTDRHVQQLKSENGVTAGTTSGTIYRQQYTSAGTSRRMGFFGIKRDGGSGDQRASFVMELSPDNSTNIGLSSPTDNTTAFEFKRTGVMKVKDGGGIQFYNYGTGTNVDNNLLDDYEEGSYTPTTTLGSGSITSTTSFSLRYVKIGRLVHVFGRLHFATSQNNLSSFEISLPFSNTSGNNSDTSCIQHVIRGNGGDPVQGIRILRVGPGGTTMVMNDHEGNQYGDLGTTTPHINVNFSYFAA